MCSNKHEPALDDLLTDPATQALMASDGVGADEIRSLLAAVRRRYGAKAPRSRSRS